MSLRALCLFLIPFVSKFSFAADSNLLLQKIVFGKERVLRVIEQSPTTHAFIGFGEFSCPGASSQTAHYQHVKADVNHTGSAILSLQISTSNCLGWLSDLAQKMDSAKYWMNSSGGAFTEPAYEEALAADTQRVISGLKQLEGFYKSKTLGYPPFYFWTGQKTARVYVYLHGLFMDQHQFTPLASQSFAQGFNSLVGVLPGHENLPDRTLSFYTSEDWFRYSKKLIEVAQDLGSEVVVVGHSIGGFLSFLNIQNSGTVQKLILLQPAFGLTGWTELASTDLGNVLKNVLGDWAYGMTPLGGQMAQDLLRNHFSCFLEQQDCRSKMSFGVPTKIYYDLFDPVVDSSATAKLIDQLGSNSVEVHTHLGGHMFQPAIQEITDF